MDASGPNDGTAEDYAFSGTPSFRTDLYASPGFSCPEIPTHAESVQLISSHNIKFTPELKSPEVEMPFTAEDGTEYTQDDYRQALVDEYTAAGIPADQVWLQSFNPEDVFYWVENTPDFGAQAVALDESGFGNLEEGSTFEDWISLLTANNVNYVGTAQQFLVEGDPSAELKMKATDYALAAQEAGLKIIAWTNERAGPGLEGYYWDTLQNIDRVEGDRFHMLHILNTEVGVEGVFRFVILRRFRFCR
jgi:glycerophosphoryl diester phosphodiesterase